MEASKECNFGYVTRCGFIRYENSFNQERGWFDNNGKPCNAPPKGYRIAKTLRLDKKIKNSIEVSKDTVFKLVVLPTAVFVSVRNYKEIIETYYFAKWCNEIVLKDRNGDNVNISGSDDLQDYETNLQFINQHANKASNTAEAIAFIEKMRLVDNSKSKEAFYALFKEQMPIAKCTVQKVNIKFRVQGYYYGQSDDAYVDSDTEMTVNGYSLENGDKFIEFDQSCEILTDGWANAKKCKTQSALGCVFATVEENLTVNFLCCIGNEKIQCDTVEQAIQKGIESIKKYTRINEKYFIY